MTDYLLYGGKGGVGKTTMAAATALALASRGQRTLVVSTDPAHSLGDALGVELGADPSSVRPDLSAVELDPEARADRYRALAESLAAEMRSVGVSVADEDLDTLFGARMPGGAEMAALDAVGEYAAESAWDSIVLDTAPTGHTLQLLDLPEVVGTAARTAGDVRRQVRQLGRRARSVVLGPAAYAGRDDGAEGYAAVEERMERVAELLRDPDWTQFRVVLRPERMVIRETERLVAALGEAGMPLGGLVVNGVLEGIDESCARCRRRRDRHRDRLEEVDATFDLPAWTVPEFEGEVDPGSLETVGERLVGPPDRDYS